MSAANRTVHFTGHRVVVGACKFFRDLGRAFGLLAICQCAVIDAGIARLLTDPAGGSLARARAAWLHRWSRIALRVLGLRWDKLGFTPVSGIVVANHRSPLDALLFAALSPCVFVAGAAMPRRPIITFLARLGGALCVDHRQPRGAVRMNFMIRRALRRRLLVVIFPERDHSDGSTLRVFATALFQPAAELGCTLTAAAIDYQSFVAPKAGFLSQLEQIVTCCRSRAVVAFGSPAFRRGDRKHLARQLRGEMLGLKLRVSSDLPPDQHQ